MTNVSRRQVLGRVGAIAGVPFAQGAPAAQAPAAAPMQPLPPLPPSVPRGVPPLRVPPRGDLVNILEYEEQAARVLTPALHALIAGGDRTLFDRITLRPRVNVPTTDLDLTATLFGEVMFAPIIIGPIADQKRFHPEGELATARGAATAKATMVISSRTSVPIEQIRATGASLWFQMFLGEPFPAARIEAAIAVGCKAVCVTVGAMPGAAARTATRTPVDWAKFASLRKSVRVPVLAKGISTPAAAIAAIVRGADGIVVSNYGGLAGNGTGSMILTLPSIIQAVAGRVPVLVDGSFRRGTDIFKALAFGARAVMIGRPVMWGLAAYGAEGAQGVIEMLQTETARYVAMTGNADLKSIATSAIKLHGVRTP